MENLSIDPPRSSDDQPDINLLAEQLETVSANQWAILPSSSVVLADTQPTQTALTFEESLITALSEKTRLEAENAPKSPDGLTQETTSSIQNSPLYDSIQDRLGGFFIGQNEGIRKGEFLVEGLFPPQGLGFVYGPPGCNKTTLLMDLAVHMSAGQVDWHGKCIKPGPVLYYGMEDCLGAFKLARGLCDLHGLQLVQRELYVPDAPLDLKTDADFVKLVAGIQRLATLNEKWPRLVVIDTLSDALSDADDSDQTQVKNLLKRAERVANNLGVFICFVHHETKNTGSLRGSGTLKAKAYSVINIKKTGNTKKRDVVVEKLRGGADGEKFKLLLEPHEWTDPNEGELSCAALKIIFGAQELVRLPPPERYRIKCHSLRPHQKAIALSIYEALSVSGNSAESPPDEMGNRFFSLSFENAFLAFANYCEGTGIAVSGSSDAAKRAEFKKKLKSLAGKPQQFVAIDDAGGHMTIWIPQDEFSTASEVIVELGDASSDG